MGGEVKDAVRESGEGDGGGDYTVEVHAGDGAGEAIDGVVSAE